MSFNPFDIAERQLKGIPEEPPHQRQDVPLESLYKTEKQPEMNSFDIAEKKLRGEPFVQNEFDLEREVERNQAQLTSRMLEAVVGLPGDLINFVGSLFGYNPNAPGSERIQEFSEAVTRGYTAPQNEFEQEMGDLMKDVALFSLPGAKHYSYARNIGIPVVSELTKEGIKYAGGSNKEQAAGKIGSMVILDILNHRSALGNAKEYASGLFQKADEMIPKGLSIKASGIKNSLENLEHNLTRGGSRPDTSEALGKIKEILGEIQPNGKIDLKSLAAYRPSINSWIDKFKGFEIPMPDKIRRQIIHNLNEVKGEVIKATEEYGRNFNPEYLKTSQAANEAYRAVSESNKIVNFIEKIASSKIKSNALKGLLGLTATGTIGGTSATLGLGAASSAGIVGTLGYKAIKTLLRSKSPTLRNHYFNILEGASKGNAAQVIKNIKPLDKAFQEMEKTGELISDV